MTESIRDMLIEAFGGEGQELYEAAQVRRDRAAKLGELQTELEATRTHHSAEIKAATERLAGRQREVDAQYQIWLRACNAVEQAKIELHQLKSALRESVRAILDEMHPPPAPMVEQWQRPAWARPEADGAGNAT